jgi:S1-C subfamily serine protease
LTTGTGFFIAGDGTLMTARHIVRDCRRIDILSETIAPVSAGVIVSEAWDLALLRPSGKLSAPAIPLTTALTPARLAAALKAYGYPNSDARRAVSADLTLVNDALPAGSIPERLRKSGYVLWLDGPLRRGFSGGPVLDEDGDVVGLVRASYEKLAHFVATGTWPLIDLIGVTEVKPRFTGEPDDADPDMRARRSIVRVVCWRERTQTPES